MVAYAESALSDYLWMWGLNDTFGKSIAVCNCFFPSRLKIGLVFWEIELIVWNGHWTDRTPYQTFIMG